MHTSFREAPSERASVRTGNTAILHRRSEQASSSFKMISLSRSLSPPPPPPLFLFLSLSPSPSLSLCGSTVVPYAASGPGRPGPTAGQSASGRDGGAPDAARQVRPETCHLGGAAIVRAGRVFSAQCPSSCGCCLDGVGPRDVASIGGGAGQDVPKLKKKARTFQKGAISCKS